MHNGKDDPITPPRKRWRATTDNVSAMAMNADATVTDGVKVSKVTDTSQLSSTHGEGLAQSNLPGAATSATLTVPKKTSAQDEGAKSGGGQDTSSAAVKSDPVSKNVVRKTCARLLNMALGKSPNSEIVANAVEEAVASQFGWVAGSDYKTKIKSRVNNIKLNGDLRTSLLNGDLSPETVASMTVDEMRSKKLVETITKSTSEMLHETELAQSNTHSNPSTILICPACKVDDVSISAAPVVAAEAGDEGKKNLQCNVCGHEWVDDPLAPNSAVLV